MEAVVKFAKRVRGVVTLRPVSGQLPRSHFLAQRQPISSPTTFSSVQFSSACGCIFGLDFIGYYFLNFSDHYVQSSVQSHSIFFFFLFFSFDFCLPFIIFANKSLQQYNLVSTAMPVVY